MPRTILIIPEGGDPAEYLERAAEWSAGEIAVGIPPALASEVSEEELPLVHIEFDPPGVEPAPFPPVPEQNPLVQMRADLDWLITYVVTGEA